MGAIVDPAELTNANAQINAAPQTASPPPQQGAPIAVGPIIDDAELANAKAQLGEPGQVSSRIPGDAKPGPNGLLWNASGGYDPQTGALIIGGKPFTPTASSAPVAAGAGILGGIPIIGPSLESGLERAVGAANSAISGTPKDQNQAAFREIVQQSQRDHPAVTTAANVGGALLGTGGAMVAAPAAFGIGAGGLVPSSLASGVTGAAIGAGDAAARNGLDAGAIENGALFGGVLGGAAPVIGRAAGVGLSALTDVASRTNPAARNIANVLSSIGMTPADASAAIAKMGPSATLADVDPALSTEAGAVAAMGGAPTSILKNAMAQRAMGADDRISGAINQYLGARPDLTALQEGIRQQAGLAASPFYNAMRMASQPMDITPVLGSIDSQLTNAVGGEKNVLNTAKNFLTDQIQTLPGPDGAPVSMVVPKSDPQALLKARQGLDDFIQKLPIAETTAGRNAARALQNVRGQLDSVLKTDPNIAAGDNAYSQRMGHLDALSEGTDLFKPGSRIEDVQRSIAGKTPFQVGAMQQGALSAVHDAMDNARQGDFSAARSLFAKSTANRAKLDALFPNAGGVFDALDGEMAMRGTEQTVAHNSATAERNAIMAKYAPQPSPGIGIAAPVIGEALAGGPGAVAAMAGKGLYSYARNAATAAARDRLTQGMASGLSAVGPPQTQFLGQVGRAYTTNPMAQALINGGSAGANLLARSQQQEMANHLLGRR